MCWRWRARNAALVQPESRAGATREHRHAELKELRLLWPCRRCLRGLGGCRLYGHAIGLARLGDRGARWTHVELIVEMIIPCDSAFTLRRLNGHCGAQASVD